MKWDVRMVGGPFDGDHARIPGPPNYDPKLVPKMWVRPCTECGGRCGDTIWSSAWVNGAEVYDREDFNLQTHTAKYVYSDLDLGPSIHEEERELVPVVAAR